MKVIIHIFCLVISIACINAQDFKPVKSAQDVIDNFIAATGGAENMKKVKSIKATGHVSGKVKDDLFTYYIGRDVFYIKYTSPEMTVIEAFDTEKNKGWISFAGKLVDFDYKYIPMMKLLVDAALWHFYYDKDKYYITYQLKDDEKVNNTDCYVVDIMQNGDFVETDYFDKQNFNKLKQEIAEERITWQFSDYNDSGYSGLTMPFGMYMKLGEFKITDYKFNTSFDKKLLEKPKEN